MAGQIPEYQPQVGLTREPLRDSSSPAAFGVGLGQAVQGVAAAAGSILTQERHLKAQFDAADKELEYGVQLDKTVEAFKNDVKAFRPAEGQSYEDGIAALREKYGTTLEGLRGKVGGALSDPLAFKNFDVRTRLQTQAALRHMLVSGDQHVEAWRGTVAKATVDSAIERSGSVTGNTQADLLNLQTQAATGIRALQEHLRATGVPDEEIQRTIHKSEADMVGKALTAYGSNFQAGLAFLNGTLPGTSLRVGYDPSNPQGESILDGAETARWLAHFTQHKEQKVGENLGAQWYFSGQRDPEKAAREYIAKGGDPAIAAKGMAQFTSLVSESHHRHELAVADTYDSLFTTITSKYDGDLERALREDEAVKRAWVALGPKQVNLRAALSKETKDSPAAYSALGDVIDLSAKPGALTEKYPTFREFQAAMQGPTGALWPQAVHMYEADSKRDVTQDVHYQAFKSFYEDRSRTTAGWTVTSGDSMRGHWSEATPEQQAMHTWIVVAAEQRWASHQQERKQSHGKASDATWFVNDINDVIMQAEKLKRAGAFRSGKVPDFAQRQAPRPAGAAYYSNSTGKYYDQQGNEVK